MYNNLVFIDWMGQLSVEQLGIFRITHDNCNWFPWHVHVAYKVCCYRFLMVILAYWYMLLPHDKLMYCVTSFSCLHVCVCVCVAAAACPVPSGAAVPRLPTHTHPPGEHGRVQRSRGERALLWPSVCPISSTSLGQTYDWCEFAVNAKTFLTLSTQESTWLVYMTLYM